MRDACKNKGVCLFVFFLGNLQFAVIYHVALLCVLCLVYSASPFCDCDFRFPFGVFVCVWDEDGKLSWQTSLLALPVRASDTNPTSTVSSTVNCQRSVLDADFILSLEGDSHLRWCSGGQLVRRRARLCAGAC